MIGVVDETTPSVGAGVCYGLISAVILADEATARAAVRTAVPRERRRPFHWCREGPTARARMIAAIEDVGVVGRAVVVPCGRRSQEAARAVALAVTVPQLLDEGCDQLLIEARTPAQDGRDRALILDLLHGHPSRPAYDWRKKGEELLWIADAIGGAIHDHLRGLDDQWYERMAKATGLVVEYRMLPAAETSPKSRQSRLPS